MATRSNTVLAGWLAGVIFGMGGLAFASVPLYRLFCAVTGYGGTPMTRGASGPGASGGNIEVRFDANTAPNLPWRFQAESRTVTVPLGEDRLAFYTGRNTSAQPVTGMATYNVSPDKAGKYFHKVACFCFDEQTLAPGQDMQFPLSFWVDPAIATDPDTRDVRTITLSYTFFRTPEDAARAGALDKAGPHVGRRADATTAPTRNYP